MMAKLKQWVPEDVCLSCDGCCRYAEKTTVWSPLFLYPEIVELTEKNIVPSCLFTHAGQGIGRPARINLIEAKGSYLCPCFDLLENKCKIYRDRPLDCQLYPFLLVRKENEAFLALDEKCPYARKMLRTPGMRSYVQDLCEFLMSKDFLKMVAEGPEIIQDYEQDVKLLASLPDLLPRAKMFDTLGSVAHVRPTEIASYFLRLMLSAPEESSDVAYQLPLIPRALPSHGVGFDILVEQLVRIEMRTVSWQEIKPKFPHPSCPLHHILRKMYGMTVDDQKDLARVLPDEAFQEIQEQRRRKPSLENPEGQCAPVGDRRKHVATEPFARAGNNRCMAAPAVGCARLVVRTHSGLVAPEDRRSFSMSQRTDGRVFPPQPTAHRYRILFVGLPQRLLRGEAPAGQIATHGPNRQPNTKALLNQILDRLARPKHEWQLELVGAAIGNQSYDCRRLVRLQVQNTRTATRLSTQSRESFGALTLIPGVDRLPGNAKYAGRLGLRHSRPDRADDPQTQTVLGVRRHITHIQNWHSQNYSTRQPICQTFLLRLVTVEYAPTCAHIR